MSLLVTALALLIGFPIAYYIAKIAGPRSRGALFLVCLLPLSVSNLIRAFGWILLLRDPGVISSALKAAGLVSRPVELDPKITRLHSSHSCASRMPSSA